MIKKYSAWQIALFIVLVLLSVLFAVFPIVWILLTAFRTTAEFFQSPSFIPKKFSLENFHDVITRGNFLLFMRNSIFVSTVVTALSIVVSTMAAYAITRLQFPGRSLVSRSIIASYLIPSALLFIPLFFLVTRIRLQDNLLSLIITYLSATVPFCAWMLYGYFSTIPKSLDEAATLDGCTKVQILRKIFVPLALPGLAVVALYSFTLCWNEFLYALVFITSTKSRTIPSGIVSWIVEDAFAWGRIMAASALSVVPTFILYFFAQKSLSGGLVAGAVKQ